jgi:hypothetical protein
VVVVVVVVVVVARAHRSMCRIRASPYRCVGSGPRLRATPPPNPYLPERATMARIFSLIVLALFFCLPAGAVQGGGGPPQPWKKTCRFGATGPQGCTVGIEMRIAPNSPCSPGCTEYCVKIVVSCPDGGPGDPAEDCETENCEVCCDSGPISITCDGQCFEVAPGFDGWDDVATDCGNATPTAAPGACP